MGFSYFNPNPAGQKVGDCTVRAIAKATGKSWDEVYKGMILWLNLHHPGFKLSPLGRTSL